MENAVNFHLINNFFDNKNADILFKLSKRQHNKRSNDLYT